MKTERENICSASLIIIFIFSNTLFLKKIPIHGSRESSMIRNIIRRKKEEK